MFRNASEVPSISSYAVILTGIKAFVCYSVVLSMSPGFQVKIPTAFPLG